MDKKEIFKFLKLQLKNLRVFTKEKDNSLAKLNIIKDDVLDSLKLINLLLKIENKYKIKLSPSDLSSKKNQTVSQIVSIIHKKISKK